jgi:hypothetical protein
MEKGKIIVFSIAGFLVIFGIALVYMLFSSGTTEEDKKAGIPPILNSKDSLTYKDMIDIAGAGNAPEKEETKKADTADIKSEISALYTGGNNNTQRTSSASSSEASTPYRPYGNKNMYTVQNREKREQEEKNYYAPKSNKVTIEKNVDGEEEESETARKKRIFEQGHIPKKNSFQASTKGVQVLKTGQTIRFIVEETVNFDGITIPKNTSIFGVVRFSGYRANVDISSININGNIYPLDVDVYSTDGMKGIPITLDTDVSKAAEEGHDEAISESSGIFGKAGKVAEKALTKRNKELAIKFLDNQRIIIVKSKN